MKVSQSATVKPLTALMRWLFLIGGLLAFIAGIQLFVLSEHTDVYFAWTIHPPLTAAFIGAGFWGGCVLFFLSARERAWARTRVTVVGGGVFTLFMLLATLLHLNLFHLGSSDAQPLVAAWVWLAVYVLLPLVLLVLVVQQLRVPGSDPVPIAPVPLWMRLSLGVQAVLVFVIGILLFLTPQLAASFWPWQLTALTAQALGAGLLASAIASVQALRENDFRNLQTGAVSYTILSGFQLLALARYAATVEWSRPGAWVYLLFWLGAFSFGLYVLSLFWRMKQPSSVVAE